MRKALALILSVGLLAAACGDNESVLTTEAAGSTATTAGTESTATTEPGSTETTVTTAAPVPEAEPGSLATLAKGRVQDPLMGSGWHRLDWGDDEETVLEGRRGTTGSDDLDVLMLVAYSPPPTLTGLAPDDVLAHVFLGFPSMDVPPGALVVYSPGDDGWTPSLVITEEQFEAALLETTDYAAAAPDGPAPMNLVPTTLDLNASTLIAMVEVLDLGEGGNAYEGEIQCDFSGDPLTCITLTDDGVLRPGDEGEDVEALQQQLKDLGYLGGTVDGKYGPGTTSAVRAFQTDYLLTRDGKAGPQTQELLESIADGTSSLLLASQTGVGSIAFGTGSEDSYAALVAALGVPDGTTGWYQDGCDGHDWFKATWDGFTAVFTDRDGTRQFDGWEVNDLSDLPTGLYIAGGIHAGTDWGDLDAKGADFFDDYLGQRWRIPAMGYTNGRFTGPVANPPAANSPIASFGTGTGGFESC